jgi:hypothetical protein
VRVSRLTKEEFVCSESFSSALIGDSTQPKAWLAESYYQFCMSLTTVVEASLLWMLLDRS